MRIDLTELILQQAKTLSVMLCAGILTESLWQLKKYLQSRSRSRLIRSIQEIGFWAASAAALSAFLYYCAFGKLSLHAILGFFIGLLLWKKICCGIMNARKLK